MDELKNIIQENRSMFDVEEPNEGHFARFEARLKEQEAPKSTFRWSNMLKVAAVAVLVVLSGLYIKDQIIEFTSPVAQKQNKEFIEAQQYYNMQVSYQMDEIDKMSRFIKPEQKEMMLDELSQMDELYTKLQRDLETMPNDPRIIEAMLSHYQMKLDILTRVVGELNNVQQINIPNHESIEI